MDARGAALWAAADDHGVVHGDGLPERVREAMQEVVDRCVWTCEHVEANRDLPPSLLPKVCVAGGRAISCLQAICVMTNHDVSYSTALRDCVLCGHRLPSYTPVFTDDAAGLSMRAPVCYPCAAPGGPLAAWAGLPGG